VQHTQELHSLTQCCVSFPEDSTNEYINNNWRPLADAVKPVLTETIANITTDVLTKLLDSLPAEFFYGDLSQ
jgi:hypothetical protein